jgi:branched-chain amino acid transport system permease protein
VTFTTLLQLLLFGLVWGGLYALIGSGLNLVFGVMKILNIAHGELLMLGAYIAFWLFSLWGISPLISVPIAALAMGLLGVIIQKGLVEAIAARTRTEGEFENATLIVFFGVLLILQNSARLAWTADYRVVNYLAEPLQLGGVSVSTNRIVVLGFAVMLAALLFLFLRFSLTGKAIRAVSQDRNTARLMGIDANLIAIVGFGIGAGAAGAAGALASMIYVITPTVGLLFTIKAFTVMVIGGLGNQIGIFVAGLSLGILESLASYTVGAEFKDVTGYVLLIGFILWRAHTSSSFADQLK